MRSNAFFEPFQIIENLHSSDIIKVQFPVDEEGQGNLGERFISADEKGGVFDMVFNRSTKKFEEKNSFKIKVGENSKVKCYDISFTGNSIVAGMSDGSIQCYRLDSGNQVFSARNSKAAILSINYIFEDNEIRAFTADSEQLVYTDVTKSENTISLNSKNLFTKEGNEINRTYLKQLLSKVDTENYTTFITK